MEIPQDATSGPCDIAIKAIVAGQLEFPEATYLVPRGYINLQATRQVCIS